MQTIIRTRAAKWLAWFLVSAIIVPYMRSGALAASQPEGIGPQNVVLFPLDKAAAVTKSQIVTELNTFLRQGLASCRKYSVIEYTERLPAIQRLVAMQPEKKSAISGPFPPDQAGITHAAALAETMSADLFLVGSVEKYTFADREGVAEVTATIQVVDAKTAKIVQTIAVTGRGTKPSATASVAELRIASEAVKDAGRKIVEQITGEEYREPQQPQTIPVVSKKSSKKSWIPLLLLSLVAGLLLGGLGGGDGGGGGNVTPDTETPPPPPF